MKARDQNLKKENKDMKKTVKIGFSLLLLALALTACATGGISTPLPDEKSPWAARIIPPDSSIPANIANYSGVWEGTYNNGRDVTIIIEKIALSLGSVSAIYSWGDLKNDQGGWAGLGQAVR